MNTHPLRNIVIALCLALSLYIPLRATYLQSDDATPVPAHFLAGSAVAHRSRSI